MARSFLPDPLELLRQAVNRLDGRANVPAGRGLELDTVMKTLQQLSGLSLALRQAAEAAMESASKRLNLPTGAEFAEMKATLQRLERKLDQLLAAEAAARPTGRRKPAAAAPSPKAARSPKPAAPVPATKAAKSPKRGAPARPISR